MRRIYVGDFKIGNEEKRAVHQVLESGRISEGVRVREFEKRFAGYIGCKYSVALNSGTSALIAGLMALNHQKGNLAGKNVITTPLSYIATSNALVLSGFNPVYVDVDPETFVINTEAIKEHFENINDIQKYSMILPVHLMGFPCEMDSINKLAKKYGLMTFEDSSQAHGTLYKNKKCGSLSAISAFSFYIAHNIQAGEMGAITTNSQEITRLVRKIKANGRMCDCPVCTRSTGSCPKLKDNVGDEDIDPRFTHDIIGYNFKAMEFQASLGIVQLKKADEIKEKRYENVKYLNDALSEFSEILQLPPLNRNVSYLAYPIIIKKGITRKRLRDELERYGIETRPLFGCIPTQQPAYSFMKKKYEGKLPIAEFLGENGFYIGCHQYMLEKDLEYIGESFKKILLNF